VPVNYLKSPAISFVDQGLRLVFTPLLNADEEISLENYLLRMQELTTEEECLIALIESVAGVEVQEDAVDTASIPNEFLDVYQTLAADEQTKKAAPHYGAADRKQLKKQGLPLLVVCMDGAGDRTRTCDLLITNQLLYQLSYTSRSREQYLL
jgi:hypothetical protein